MTESIWHRTECSPGRSYMLGTEPYVKYDDQEAIVASIKSAITELIDIRTAVRLTLDSELSNAERTIIAVPLEADNSQLLENLARILAHSFMGYYISAEPQSTHFGIANLILDGKVNSLLKRELEKVLNQVQDRADIAGRLLSDVELVSRVPVPASGDVFLAETIRKGLDIHLGYRVFVTGSDINYTKIFVPITAGKEIIEHIYYNIEQILHHNFISYDETGDRYLSITETLVFKDLEAVLKRAKSKEITRDKILNNLQFNMIEKRKVTPELEMLAGDSLYDYLNQIQDTKLQQATEASRKLFVSYNQEAVHPLAEDSEKTAEVKEESKADEEPKKRVRRTREAPGTPPSGVIPPRSEQPMRRAPGVTQQGGVQVPQPPREDTRVPSPGQGSSVPSPDKVKA